MTIRQFIQSEGSPEAAAAKAGVKLSTIYRWLSGESKPRGNNKRRLKELGVSVS